MSENLPVPAGGGALVPSTGTAVDVGDVSRDSGPSAPAPIASSSEVQRLAGVMRRDLVIDGFGEDQLDACMPIVQDFVPALHAALNDEHELARVADNIRDTLVGRGLLSWSQVERIQPILRRYSQQCEALLIPEVPDSQVKARITEIEKWMSALKGTPEYKSYYGNLGVQREYRKLLQRRQ